MKLKVTDNKTGIKGRLSFRGFEEEQSFRADSPPCSRKRVSCAFSFIASKKQSINSIDVETTFLQGQNFEDVLVRPPKEAQTKKFGNCINVYMDQLMLLDTVA